MKYKKFILPLITIALTSLALSCRVSIPKGAVAVKPFNKNRYLGKWFEIARLDFKYEKNLNNTTAEYSLNKDGSIKVDNRGYNYVKKEWTQSIGKAKFVENSDEARLKVSFFGPFYSGYNVIALDGEYKYALVAGDDLKYLWILSRTASIPEDIKQNYLRLAKSLGYKTENLVWVKHDQTK
jgi:apolipoprotein D and lipocalin family protein